MSSTEDQRREQLQAVAGKMQSGVEKGVEHFRRSLLIKACLLGILGLCALFWPGTSVSILVRLVGAFCVVDGVTGLVNAFRADDGQSYIMEAVISLLIGGILLLWPGVTSSMVLMLFGAWVLYTGMRNFLYSRQLDESDPQRASIKTIGIAATVVGIILLVWPGAGVTTIAWVIGIAALVIAALLVFVASRLQRVQVRVETIGQ
ncbi:MAG: DUF308 domain-containing protein [Proteobacteria bacterium]|nr:DUF308 domain-containing protein [Pseudomonadota bacterium]